MRAGCKEGQALKNWCLRTVVLEKTPQSPLGCKEIQAVNLKGNQSWILIERSDAETEAPGFWSPDVNSRLIGKDPDAGKDWRQNKKRAAEDEMVGWHHWFNGHEFDQTPRVGDGQGILLCCSPRGRKELDTTEPLNLTVVTCLLYARHGLRSLHLLIYLREFYYPRYL